MFTENRVSAVAALNRKRKIFPVDYQKCRKLKPRRVFEQIQLEDNSSEPVAKSASDDEIKRYN